MIVGTFTVPQLHEVFGDLLPDFLTAVKRPDVVDNIARLIKDHPDRKGVLLAYLAIAVARRTRDRELAMRVLEKAFQHLTDNYPGLLYANWCGVAVILICQAPPATGTMGQHRQL